MNENIRLNQYKFWTAFMDQPSIATCLVELCKYLCSSCCKTL